MEGAPRLAADEAAGAGAATTPDVEMKAAPATPASPTAAPKSTRRRGHRPEADVWRYLTHEPNAHRGTVSCCMHCKREVCHHRKSEKARSHLNHCAGFRAKMRKVRESQRPDWVDLSLRLRGIPARAERQQQQAARATAAAVLPIVEQLKTEPVSQVHQEGAPTDQGLKSVESEPRALVLESGLALPTGAEGGATASPANSEPCAYGGVREALAMHCYLTGVPLASLTEKHLVAAFQRALGSENSTLQLPSPDELSGKLLDDACASTRTQVGALVESRKTNTLTCNSWWGRRANEPAAVQYALRTEEHTLLLETARPTASQWQDAEFRAAELIRVMASCKHNVCGAITDCSQGSQLVWRKLRELFPAKFFHGCASHGLNLLIQDIFGPQRPGGTLATPSAAGGDSMGVESDSQPFAELRQLKENCRIVFKLLQQDEQANAELTRLLQLEGESDEGAPTLRFPAEEHWHELKAGFESFLAASSVLRRVVAEPSFVSEAPSYRQGQRVYITNTVLHPEFVASLEKAIAILEPITSLLALLERPGMPCSEVFASFAKTLPDTLNIAAGLDEHERSHLLMLNQSRFNLMYGDGLGVAYLLDPKYVGDGLSVEIRKRIEDLIFEFPVVAAEGASHNGVDSSDERKFDMAQQLTQYVIEATRERTNRSFRYLLLVKEKKTVLQYWLTDGQRWPLLQQLACQVFCMPSSSVTLEREIAEAGALSNGLKNSDVLLPSVQDKILFVRANSRLLVQPRPTASNIASSSC